MTEQTKWKLPPKVTCRILPGSDPVRLSGGTEVLPTQVSKPNLCLPTPVPVRLRPRSPRPLPDTCGTTWPRHSLVPARPAHHWTTVRESGHRATSWLWPEASPRTCAGCAPTSHRRSRPTVGHYKDHEWRMRPIRSRRAAGTWWTRRSRLSPALRTKCRRMGMEGHSVTCAPLCSLFAGAVSLPGRHHRGTNLLPGSPSRPKAPTWSQEHSLSVPQPGTESQALPASRLLPRGPLLHNPLRPGHHTSLCCFPISPSSNAPNPI